MNRLKFEKSPYLKQHADNPVNWYPWKKETFEKAKKEDKPLFISIGYSTCHWCHVMNEECFQDVEVAKLLNDTFIPVKVDREERRDIDNIYILAAQIMNGNAGWPLNIMATPDKKPFFAATYIPKQSLLKLIPQIKSVWKNEKEKVLNIALQIFNIMRNIENVSKNNNNEIDENILEYTFETLYNEFDVRYGGFSKSPKFPLALNINFLLRYYEKTKNEKALGMALKTLTSIRLGGIFDHVSGGIHRYSVDEKWLIPHFEKTLYDQALISESYINAYEITKDDFYLSSAKKIIDYVVNELSDFKWGFYSGQDADAEYYIWSEKELVKSFGDGIREIFDISEEGNFFDEKTGKKTGKNVLSIKSIDKLEKVEKIVNKLKTLRNKRKKPDIDKKILLDWNSLMIKSLLKYYLNSKDERFLQIARKNLDFLIENFKKNDKYFHQIIDNELMIDGFIDDYIFLIDAILTLYEIIDEKKYLNIAKDIMDLTLKYFWDNENGGFFFSAEFVEDIPLRKKEFIDSVIPSGNSRAIQVFKLLSKYEKRNSYEKLKEELVNLYSNFLKKSLTAYCDVITHLF